MEQFNADATQATRGADEVTFKDVKMPQFPGAETLYAFILVPIAAIEDESAHEHYAEQLKRVALKHLAVKREELARG